DASGGAPNMSAVSGSRSGVAGSSGMSSSVIAIYWKLGGDRTTTRSETRCGCFLPDLTGLARRPPVADLRAQYRDREARAQAPRRLETLNAARHLPKHLRRQPAGPCERPARRPVL